MDGGSHDMRYSRSYPKWLNSSVNAIAWRLRFLPPDVNEANLTFVATEKGIRFAMAGIKGIGTGAVEAIVQERTKGGPYKSLIPIL